MRPLTTILAGAGAMLALAVGVPALGAPAATTAVGSASPACPASLRSVPGGARDAEQRGFDDGAVGPGEAYRPGQLLVRLDAGTSQQAFDCVLRELGAVKIAGGRGRAGFAHMPDLMLIELPPNRSVSATSRLLLARRYRFLVDAAQPNDVSAPSAAPCPDLTADPPPPARFPNDPLFPFQWGLDSGNEAAKTNTDLSDTVKCAEVAKWPGVVENGQTLKVGDAVQTMRIPQAWPLLKRWYWFNRSVKVGIVDDSLVQHPDLEGSVLRGASRTVSPVTITKQHLKVTATAGSFRIIQGSGDETCPIAFDASADEIRSALERRVAVMCDVPATEAPAPQFNVLLVTGAGGTFRLTIGSHAVDLAANTVATDATGQAFEAAISAASPALKTEIDAGNLKIKRLADPSACAADPGECSYWMIARRGALASGATPSVDGANLLTRLGLGLMRGNAAVGRLRYTVRPPTHDPEPGLLSVTPSHTSFLKDAFKDSQRWTFAPADAAAIKRVEASGYEATRPADPTWPGQQEGKAGARHGQLIAGIIGARANNEIGMAGVLGPYVKAKLVAAVTPLDTAAELVAIEYLAGEARVPVVNWSRGTTTKPGARPQVEQELTDPQAEDPRPVDLSQQQMGRYPATLFVVAAGNSATNLNHLGPRLADPYSASGADLEPCGPKGMGVTAPPGRAQAGREGQAKGGVLSMLRMPDGTFDRGNILCVAALAPPRQETARKDYKADEWRQLVLADFSSWGAGIVDVGAPGEGIIGTGLNNGYAVVDGTSFAAPLVAGVAGLINARFPGIDPSLVKCAILSSATEAPLAVSVLKSAEFPFRGYNLPDTISGRKKVVLTVPGMVVATEALSAAAHLRNKTTGRRKGKLIAEGNGPTCVQERGAETDDGPGPWENTETKDVPKPPDPAPDPNAPPAPGPVPPAGP